MRADRWRLQLLGELRATRGTWTVSRFKTQKTAGLLGFLAYHSGVAHAREVLIETFWPDFEPASGRNNLSQALSALRHQLEPPGVKSGSVLVATRATVELRASQVSTDVGELRESLAQASRATGDDRERHLGEAVALSRGELLPGHYQDWIGPARDELRGQARAAACELARLRGSRGGRAGAILALRRAVLIDPLAERAHGELMRLLDASGEPLEALRHYDELERILESELDQIPSADTRDLAAAIARRVTAAAPERSRPSAPPPASSPTKEVPLVSPVPTARPLAKLFGREAEVARLEADLGPSGPRLVTITGTGGIGKTSLALEVVTRLEAAGRQTAFVALAEHRDARALPGAIARALRVRLSPNDDALTRVVGELRGKSFVLVLDNLEQIARDAAPVVRSLVEGAPDLACLVTSRLRLGIPGERELALSALPLPDEEDARDVARLRAVPSVALFLDRVLAVRPGFELTAENAAATAELVRRLEGIPLALALAAGRAQVLSPAQILERLPARLDFLATRDRGVPARHETLRAAVTWSYRLLSPELQTFFAELSVFRGGFTLEAAEAVCGDGASPVLDRVSDLRECSLVSVKEGPETRIELLETVRELAAELLAPEARLELARRHALFYASFAETLRKQRKLDDAAWCDRIAEDMENARAVLETSSDQEDLVEASLRLASALTAFWCTRGPLTEARRLLEQLLERATAPTRGRALGLAAGARLALFQGDSVRAGELAQEASQLARGLGAKEPLESSLGTLAWVLLFQGFFARARAAYEEAAAIGAERGIPFDRFMLMIATCAENQGDVLDARGFFERAMAEARASGSRERLASARRGLGQTYLRTGDLERARACAEEAIVEMRSVASPGGTGSCLVTLAMIAELSGDATLARSRFEEALAIFRERDDPRTTGNVLKYLAALEVDAGEPDRALPLIDEAERKLRQADDRLGLGHTLGIRGDALRDQGAFDAARARYREALALLRERAMRAQVPDVLESVVLLELALGRLARAAVLLGAAVALARAVLPLRTRARARALEAARRRLGERLGEPAFREALRAGEALSWLDAVDLALSDGAASTPDGAT